MKERFYLYQRDNGTFYLQDGRTGKQQSLKTKDRTTAEHFLETKRQTSADPAYNQFLLKTCLATQDPLLPKRTWITVMEQMQSNGKDSTRSRCARAMSSKALNPLRKALRGLLWVEVQFPTKEQDSGPVIFEISKASGC